MTWRDLHIKKSSSKKDSTFGLGEVFFITGDFSAPLNQRVDWSSKIALSQTAILLAFGSSFKLSNPSQKLALKLKPAKWIAIPPAKKNEFPTLTRSYEWLWWAMHFVVVEDIDFRKKTKTLWLETNSINFIQNLPGRTRGVFAVESHTLTGGIYH